MIPLKLFITLVLAGATTCEAIFFHNLNYNKDEWTWEKEDSDFVVPEDFLRQQFAYSSPETYLGEYTKIRDSCTEWSQPMDLYNFSLQFMRDETRYHGRFTQEKTPWELPLIRDGPGSQQRRGRASSCMKRSVDANGDVVEHHITRLGPIHLDLNEDPTFSFIPSQPTGKETFYLVETMDGYYNVDGEPLTFPPLHPHHAATLMTGFDHNHSYSGNGTFKGFTPFTPMTSSMFAIRKDLIQTTANIPGFNIDLYGCKKGLKDPANACFYTKLPDGYWMPLYPGHDFWANSMIEQVPPGPRLDVYLEYGRKYITPKAGSNRTPKPTFMLDFSTVGNGDLYNVQGSSISWHTFKMPYGGKFLSSWYHTHGVSESELWVMDQSPEAFLPKAIYESCKRPTCEPGVGMQAEPRRRGYSIDVKLEPFGIDILGLQQMIKANAPGAVRCRYKTRNVALGGFEDASLHMYGRGALFDERLRGKCENWTFSPGAPVTMVVFTEELRGPAALKTVPAYFAEQGNVPQHHRWWPLVDFDLPPTFEAKELAPKCLNERPHPHHKIPCAECLEGPPQRSCKTCVQAGFDCSCSCPGQQGGQQGGPGGANAMRNPGRVPKSSQTMSCKEKKHHQYHATCSVCLRDPKGGNCEKCIAAGFDCGCACGGKGSPLLMPNV